MKQCLAMTPNAQAKSEKKKSLPQLKNFCASNYITKEIKR
jgi:hypothetical protein